MANNPFEDDDAEYLVHVNDENQHTLWPVGPDIPAGWTLVQEASSRADSLAYVEEHWTDMRPASLISGP
ncbi:MULTISPECIES: MbtH family protein [Streptomyces]|uniref:MbtH family protein n=1 Tax=Streptomyces TaxID=1883 RepID=UPI001E3734CF|nr:MULTISPECIES: MbtH family NRPS accessory protein [Streptomyces]UFQ18045.1 MbtH family NRPS accessory protein [Streptomyces huasconensis]WCL87656.1 MbtH family NRPS accessory protein [Streptomyces sp. JCM 35825]